MTTDRYRAAGGYRDALAHSEYRALLGAFVVSMLGGVVAALALTVLVYRRTGSSLLSALTFALTFLPYALGGTLLSGLADRVAPRRLLVGCDLACAAVVAVMTLPGLPVPALLALLSGMSLLPPLSAGARAALLPDLLPPGAVVPGRSLLRIVAQGAQVAGYAAGGGLLAGLPPRAVLGVEAAAFAGSALILRAFLRPHQARAARPGTGSSGDAPEAPAAVTGGTAEGVTGSRAAGPGDAPGVPAAVTGGTATGTPDGRAGGAGGTGDAAGTWGARGTPGAGRRSVAGDSLRGLAEMFRIGPLRRALLLGWIVPFFVVAPEGLAAPAVAARGLPPSAVGWWLTCLPLGTVAGELAGIRLIPAARRGQLVRPLAACGFVPLLAFVARPAPVPAMLLLAASGLCGAYLLGVDQLLLEAAPPRMLGRVYTVTSAALMTVQGTGFAAAGALAEVLAPDLVIALAGAAGLTALALATGPRPPARIRRGRAGRRAARGAERRVRRRARAAAAGPGRAGR